MTHEEVTSLLRELEAAQLKPGERVELGPDEVCLLIAILRDYRIIKWYKKGVQ